MEAERRLGSEAEAAGEVVQVGLLARREEAVGQVSAQRLAIPLLEFVLTAFADVITDLSGDGDVLGLGDQAFARRGGQLVPQELQAFDLALPAEEVVEEIGVLVRGTGERQRRAGREESRDMLPFLHPRAPTIIAREDFSGGDAGGQFLRGAGGVFLAGAGEMHEVRGHP